MFDKSTPGAMRPPNTKIINIASLSELNATSNYIVNPYAIPVYNYINLNLVIGLYDDPKPSTVAK